MKGFVLGVAGALLFVGSALAHYPSHGDANGDKAINAKDAVMVMQYTAGMLGNPPCLGPADVNIDDVVDTKDAQLILQYTAGVVAGLPIE